jgi:IS5 family transposase
VLADSGYQGLEQFHAQCALPLKRSKNKPLTAADRQTNRDLGSRRIIVEHIIRSLKRFKILSARYRNRRKRFGLRFNLIAGLYNFE